MLVVLVAKRGGGVRCQDGHMLVMVYVMVVYVIGPTWGLVDKMACCVDFANEE